MKRSGSNNLQFVKRIPADIREQLIGRKLYVPVAGRTRVISIKARTQSIRFSLETCDPGEARQREAEALGVIEAFFISIRSGTAISLTQKQATALGGDLFRAWASGEGRERTTVWEQNADGSIKVYSGVSDDDVEEAGFESATAKLEKLLEDGDPDAMEAVIGPIVDRILTERGVAEVDLSSRDRLCKAFVMALRDAMDARRRNAAGDYSPHPSAERFPTWGSPSSTQTTIASPKVTLTELLEGWWREARAGNRKPSTYEGYKGTVTKLAKFLSHEDASRITRENIVAFKDYRLSEINPRTGKPISAKTVKDADLTALRAVFGWGVSNGRIKSSPAETVSMKAPKRRVTRGKSFTEKEAAAILKAALHAAPGMKSELPQTYAARRWVPWLMAYSGARVGEMLQLRKQDIRHDEDCWFMVITPDAGTVKTNEMRKVPLHPLNRTGFAGGRLV